MDTHLAEKLINEITEKLKKSSTGKTTLKSSSIFKKLGFYARKKSDLIDYLEQNLYSAQIAINNIDQLKSITRNGDQIITFYNQVDNVFAGQIEISNAQNTGFGPEEHQVAAIKKLNKYKDSEDYATILVLPTGGGKTFTASYWLGKNILDKGGKVLWIAHRHSLIDQAMEGFIKVANKSVYSNIDKVKFRLISGLHDKSVKIQEDDQLVIAGIQSLNYALPTIEKWIEKNDVTLVIDEAHHSIASSYLKIIKAIQKHNDGKIKLIGLTATPTRINDEEEAKLWTLYKDKKAYEIGLDELINKGFLAKPNFIPVKTNIDFISELELSEEQVQSIIEKDDIAKGLGKEIVKKISENSKRNDFIVNHYIQHKEDYGKTLVFAIDILNAIALAKLFNEKGVTSDFVISSTADFQGNNQSSSENKEKIELFEKGEIEVLVNVQIMTEGTDIPSIQSIFLTRPTNSKTLMTQMIGRGLRGLKAGGTKEANIVSFIDDWQSKIYWGNAEEIMISANLDLDVKSPAYKKMVKQLVSVDLLEQFILSQSQEFEDFFDHTDFNYFLPLGFYHFDVEYTGEDTENTTKNVSILIYDSMQNAYERLMEDLESVIKKTKKLSSNETIAYVIENYFKNVPQLPTVKKENIVDLLHYYTENNKKPSFITFEDREKYDLDVIAEPLANIDSDKERRAKIQTLFDENITIQEFYKDYGTFKKLIDKVVLKLNDPETYSYTAEINVDYERVDLGDKSLHEIKSENYQYYTFLREKTFLSSLQDFNGEKFFTCQDKNCKVHSKRKGIFQIDHIISRNQNGKTILENLQVLCISCNRKKSG